MSYCLNSACPAPQNLDDHRFCQSCGSKLWLKDRYQALKLIGQGGFGRTFLAIDHDKPSKPQCVIKQFFPQLQGTGGLAKAAELFAEEAKRLDELGNHPQIPELLAYFTHEDQRQYLVQEYIAGENLEQELKRQGVFNQTKIRELLTDLLPVLDFIHQRQVIHRDIKPENIIRRQKDNKLVLVDFGAAKAVTPLNRSVTGTMIGSAEYVAPEQMNGKAVNASDLYSLGVTCLYLLTGISPFDLFDSGEHEWVWRQYLVNNPVNDDLGKVLDKLVIFGTKKRYQSAQDVLPALASKASISPKTTSKTLASKSSNITSKQPAQDYAQLYGQAYVAYGQGNYEKAANYIQAMAVAFPEDPNVLLLQGHICVGLEQYETAQQKYEAVLRLTDRQDLQDCANQALLEINKFCQISTSSSKKATSKTLASKSLNITSKQPAQDYAQLYGQAYVAHGQGNYEKAARYIQEMAAVFPEDPNVLLLYGHIYVGLEQYANAQQKYQALLKLTQRQDLIDCAQKALVNIDKFCQISTSAISQPTTSYQNKWTDKTFLKAYEQGQRNFENQDLKNLILAKAFLPSINCYNANLSYTNFQDADLTRADFGKAILSKTIFKNSNLKDAYFGYANLENADFRGAILTGANFKYANLKGTNFCGVDLSSTQISPEQLVTVKKNWFTIMPKHF